MKKIILNSRIIIFSLIFIFSLSSIAVAGNLSDFEDSIIEKNKRVKKTTKKSKNKSGSNMDSDDITAAILYGLAVGGIATMERVREGERKDGDALIPFARIDLSVQDVASDVVAFDARAEFGYGAFGAQVRRTTFNEENTKDVLDLLQSHILYRISPVEQFEVDLGLGTVTLNGGEVHSGVSFTMPVMVRFHEYLGFEYRPAWASINGNHIEDYDYALIIGSRFASLRAGYRIVQSWNNSLEGPYLGLALHF
ncbi:MAG: hypothetical protein KAT46_08015 [Deltaproteobacteria bacterium]|nr:hypothetical protein [Deltaproteobacteria bacterium]